MNEALPMSSRESLTLSDILSGVEIGRAHRKVVLLAAGGTGGHMYPASALASKLKEQGYKVHLATDKRGAGFLDRLEPMVTHRLLAATIFGVNVLTIPARLVILLVSLLQALMLIAFIRPVVIIGFGGYPSLPPVVVGRLLRRRVLVHEQNAVLGRANRLAAWLGSYIATSYADTLNMGKNGQLKGKRRVHQTGNPLRADVLRAARKDYRPPSSRRPLEVLVFGGSQGARVFDEVVPQAIALFNKRIKRRLHLVQQVRKEAMAELLTAYHALGIHVELRDFFDDMPARMRQAHLTICRGGGSTISEIMALGAPSIIVPLAGSLDQDQANNAYALAENGGTWLMLEEDFTPETLADKLVEILSDVETLQAVSARALGMADIAAADKLARYTLCLAHDCIIDVDTPDEESVA